MKNTMIPSIMAFYHGDGLVPAWKQAMKFAGKGGRLATMQDIADLRIGLPMDHPAWDNYFTTSSAEYLGRGKDGKWLIIVAHGVGPMATLDGACKAYSHEYKDRSRRNNGGRITQREFLDLEAGNYGKVQIIDWSDQVSRYQYSFLEHLRESEASTDPLILARFGARAKAYVARHAEFSREFIQRECRINDIDPFIIQLKDASNCSYGNQKYPPRAEDGTALAHLLAVSGLRNTGLSGAGTKYPRHSCLCSDISAHNWSDGTRFVGIQSHSTLDHLHPGVNNVRGLIKENWKELLVPIPQPQPVGFRLLTRLGDEWFTTVPKKGDGLDNYVPEFHVLSIRQIGEPREFTTTIGGYYGLFKYGIKEVEALRPPMANGYTIVGDIEIISKDGNPTHHKTKVQFYEVKADVTRRLMRENDIRNDNELLMRLLFKPEVQSTVVEKTVEPVPA